MADGGIDRKMEERMEFTTSKEVEIGKAEPPTVAPVTKKPPPFVQDVCAKAQ
jgi:hypothetical protein